MARRVAQVCPHWESCARSSGAHTLTTRPVARSFFHGLRQQEIAGLLGLHRNTVALTLKRFHCGQSLTNDARRAPRGVLTVDDLIGLQDLVLEADTQLGAP